MKEKMVIPGASRHAMVVMMMVPLTARASLMLAESVLLLVVLSMVMILAMTKTTTMRLSAGCDANNQQMSVAQFACDRAICKTAKIINKRYLST